MRRLALLSIGGVLLLCIGLGIGLMLQPTPEPSADSTRTASETLREAYRVVTEHYVERVKGQRVANRAITGMLSSLDPHSVFIEAERMQEVRESFNASFEGIGITYELIAGPDAQDTMSVVTVLDEGPSARAGLRTGDRIVSIDGQSAIGYSHEKIQSTIKGRRGTTVEVGVRRPGASGTAASAPSARKVSRFRCALSMLRSWPMIARASSGSTALRRRRTRSSSTPCGGSMARVWNA